MRNLITLLVLLVAPVGFGATITNYVDSDWAGPSNGTANQPWSSLNWTTINTELASGNVVIYFSAREATSIADDKYDTAGNGVQRAVDLVSKTDTSGNLLTLDGKSYYNTNDAAPVWIANTGTNMCVIQQAVSQNGGHVKKNNITIHGFRIACNINNKEVSICGDNFTVEDCEMFHTSGIVGTGGVGLLIVPTADGSHEGSSEWCPVCTNIVIQRNSCHDSQGEQLYIGGGGLGYPAAGSGYPSHSQILIASNQIYNCGSRGDQGDGIDIKGGIKSLTVVGNTIYNMSNPNGGRAIVTQGQTNGATGTSLIIERNNIHDDLVDDAAIAISDTWGVPQGIIIRNNILANFTGGSARGIHAYSSQDQIKIQNNTIYHAKGVGLDNGGGQSLLLRNNLFISNNANGIQFDLSAGSNDSDYNANNFTRVSSGEGIHSISMTGADVTNSIVNPGGQDFHLKAGGVLVGVAQTQTGYSNDFDGAARTVPWDIGAYELGGPVTNATLNVTSENPVSGVAITVSLTDNNGNGNGSTAFSRLYTTNVVTTLTAPATVLDGVVLKNFSKWTLDGSDFTFTTVATILMGMDHVANAIYSTPPPPPPSNNQGRPRVSAGTTIRR